MCHQSLVVWATVLLINLHCGYAVDLTGSQNVHTGRRDVVVDVIGKRRDCGFNLLARIAAVNHCDQCPTTKARLVMAANYLHVLSESETDDKMAARYETARSFLTSQCAISSEDENTAEELILKPDEFMAARSPAAQVELMESLPKETLTKMMAGSRDEEKEGELDLDIARELGTSGMQFFHVSLMKKRRGKVAQIL